MEMETETYKKVEKETDVQTKVLTELNMEAEEKVRNKNLNNMGVDVELEQGWGVEDNLGRFIGSDIFKHQYQYQQQVLGFMGNSKYKDS